MKRQEKNTCLSPLLPRLSGITLWTLLHSTPSCPTRWWDAEWQLGLVQRAPLCHSFLCTLPCARGHGQQSFLSCFSTVLLCIGDSPLGATAPVQSSVGCRTWQGTCCHLGSSPQAAASKVHIHMLWPGGLHSCSVEV